MDSLDGTRYVLLDQVLEGRLRPEAALLEAKRLEAERLETELLQIDRAKAESPGPEPEV